jgi:uncharacterized protein YbjT (DUF2867 family)
MKKYLITGSIGNISRPIIQSLVKAGHSVNVITGSVDRVKDIEALGAKALVGNLHDATFVKAAFQDVDVAYTMIPPIWKTNNWRKSQNEVAKNYFHALEASNVTYVVNLSSVGAHAGNGVGPVDGLYDFEQLLNKLEGVHVKHLRPSFFYHNLLAQIGLIKQAGFLGANYGEGEKLFLVHPKDIAAAAFDELTKLSFTGKSVRYVIGDERSGQEIAAVLGNAISKPLNWVVFTDEQQKAGLLQAGLSETHSASYTDMGKAIRTGLMQKDAREKLPSLSPTKLEDFAKEFALAFSTQS